MRGSTCGRQLAKRSVLRRVIVRQRFALEYERGDARQERGICAFCLSHSFVGSECFRNVARFQCAYYLNLLGCRAAGCLQRRRTKDADKSCDGAMSSHVASL